MPGRKQTLLAVLQEPFQFAIKEFHAVEEMAHRLRVDAESFGFTCLGRISSGLERFLIHGLAAELENEWVEKQREEKLTRKERIRERRERKKVISFAEKRNERLVRDKALLYCGLLQEALEFAERGQDPVYLSEDVRLKRLEKEVDSILTRLDQE